MISTPTPDALSAALLGIGQPASADEVSRLAAALARHGSEDRLSLALAHDESGRTLALLNAWRAFQAEEADPALRVARLHREALALDHRAEPAWVEAAEMHGKAAARRLRGETDLAETFDHRALAAERFAAALEAQAFAKRLQIAQVEQAAALTTALHAIAA